ncbi:hypothetical protein TBLA_0C06250 [Henningerozyma blattae CBS 6284]|uniref:Alpha-1,3-mannosyltransferase n=1 Tax=Henningerozyma blattae (strain ATCC 34711 / CBS 6284 / DSM 70876 / NBRC 10599 / NRRL Y-10934 / UCD 77-7) TaxID=1071380 RepID=I2H218_HENB6|nr:hypothetical protein TBLA_0C06250 [Tetrapisispora blattae CBS 6284]CCH60420.1 hypothetical protein TBLA_0C06250 [Tetrapisispora blattae CBS 6284]
MSKISIGRRTWRLYFIVTIVILSLYSFFEPQVNDNVSYYVDTLQNNAKIKQNIYLQNSLSSLRVTPLNRVPVSPLEVIPDYDRDVKIKRSSFFNYIFNRNYFKDFQDLDIDLKCDFYLKNLYEINQDWTNDFDSVSYLTDDVNENEMLENLKKKMGSQLVDKDALTLFRRKNDITLAYQRLRIYDRCFIQNNVDINKIFNKDLEIDNKEGKFQNNFHQPNPKLEYSNQFEFEHRMFPFLKYFNENNFTEMIPHFKGPDGKDIVKGKIPIIDPTDGSLIHSDDYNYDITKTFWSNWNILSSKVGKRGIILSFSDGQTETALRLISTLRFMGNRLPIQIIFKNDISDKSIEQVFYVATNKNYKPFNDQVNWEHKNDVKQNVYFVDIENLLDPKYKDKFSRFKNKWLASNFNMFEEFLFIDTDAITYIDPNDYFELQEYKESGTVFFRDRTWPKQWGDEAKCSSLMSLLPPRILESKYFNNYPLFDVDYIKETPSTRLSIEEKIYKRYFENGRIHQMESGVFAINKNKHIISILTGTILNIDHVTESCGYGDKEFFWFGFMISGHKYRFYNTTVGVIGNYDPIHKSDVQEVGEICSVQISHFTHDNKLMWINGGSNNCKFGGFSDKDWDKKELKRLGKSFSSKDEFKNFYHIKPISSNYGMISGDGYSSWRKIDQLCGGYYYCVRYERRLADADFKDGTELGELVIFDDQDRLRIDYTNTVWAYFDHKALEKEMNPDKN